MKTTSNYKMKTMSSVGIENDVKCCWHQTRKQCPDSKQETVLESAMNENLNSVDWMWWLHPKGKGC